MRKLFSGALLALLASGVAAFPIDLEMEQEFERLGAVVVSDGRLAVVRVTNGEEFAVRCDAVFHNGPEIGRVRRAIIEPAGSEALSWMPRRTVVRLRVELSCEPHETALAQEEAEET
jgi:hypothetical protein